MVEAANVVSRLFNEMLSITSEDMEFCRLSDILISVGSFFSSLDPLGGRTIVGKSIENFDVSDTSGSSNVQPVDSNIFKSSGSPTG